MSREYIQIRDAVHDALLTAQFSIAPKHEKKWFHDQAAENYQQNEPVLSVVCTGDVTVNESTRETESRDYGIGIMLHGLVDPTDLTIETFVDMGDQILDVFDTGGPLHGDLNLASGEEVERVSTVRAFPIDQEQLARNIFAQQFTVTYRFWQGDDR